MTEPEPKKPMTTPRWVKVSIVITAAFVIGFVVLHLTGYGFVGTH